MEQDHDRLKAEHGELQKKFADREKLENQTLAEVQLLKTRLSEIQINHAERVGILENERTELQSQLRASLVHHAHSQEQLAEHEKARSLAQEEILTKEMAHLDARAELESAKAAHAAAIAERDRQYAGALADRDQQHTGALAERDQQHAEVLQARLGEKDEEVGKLQKTLADREQSENQTLAEVQSLKTRLSETQINHAQASESGARLERETSTLKSEMEEEQTDIRELEHEVAEVTRKLNEQDDRIAELELEVTAETRALEATGEEVEAGRTQILALGEELAVTKKVAIFLLDKKFSRQFQRVESTSW